MEGKQKSAYQQIQDLLSKIEEGFYGQDDNFDADPFFDDFEDIYNNIEDQ